MKKEIVFFLLDFVLIDAEEEFIRMQKYEIDCKSFWRDGPKIDLIIHALND